MEFSGLLCSHGAQRYGDFFFPDFSRYNPIFVIIFYSILLQGEMLNVVIDLSLGIPNFTKKQCKSMHLDKFTRFYAFKIHYKS